MRRRGEEASGEAGEVSAKRVAEAEARGKWRRSGSSKTHLVLTSLIEHVHEQEEPQKQIDLRVWEEQQDQPRPGAAVHHTREQCLVRWHPRVEQMAAEPYQRIWKQGRRIWPVAQVEILVALPDLSLKVILIGLHPSF